MGPGTTVTVNVLDCAADHGAVSLIAPVGLNTDHQQLVSFLPSFGHVVELVAEHASGQLAAVMRGPADAQPVLRYTFEETDGGLPAGAREGGWESRYTRPSPDLREEVAALCGGAGDDMERMRRIVGATGAKFRYDHPEQRFNDGADQVPVLSCGLTPGSCIDINTYLLASCCAAGIPAAYFAGYFFPEERGGITNDMHCWVVAWPGGVQQEWDIAHHMKMGRDVVEPAYNPKPGRRFAMSWGRGHQYTVDGLQVSFSHFSEPEWLMPDGTTRRTHLEVRLKDATRGHLNNVSSIPT